MHLIKLTFDFIILYILFSRTNKEAEIHNEQSETNRTSTTAFPREQLNENVYILIYAGLIIALFVLALMRTISFFVMCMKSSIKLHNKMFSTILRAPIYVFDVNPVGELTILLKPSFNFIFFRTNFESIY